jgi:hypothetical protein
VNINERKEKQNAVTSVSTNEPKKLKPANHIHILAKKNDQNKIGSKKAELYQQRLSLNQISGGDFSPHKKLH